MCIGKSSIALQKVTSFSLHPEQLLHGWGQLVSRMLLVFVSTTANLLPWMVWSSLRSERIFSKMAAYLLSRQPVRHTCQSLMCPGLRILSGSKLTGVHLWCFLHTPCKSLFTESKWCPRDMMNS